LLRYRARIEEMARYRDSPEHLLAISGYMNETVQEYILSHNYTFSTDPHEVPDPDHMSYEVLPLPLSNCSNWATRSAGSARASQRRN
jgi:hypothetical protein